VRGLYTLSIGRAFRSVLWLPTCDSTAAKPSQLVRSQHGALVGSRRAFARAHPFAKSGSRFLYKRRTPLDARGRTHRRLKVCATKWCELHLRLIAGCSLSAEYFAAWEYGWD